MTAKGRLIEKPYFKPIDLGGFLLTETGVDIVGRPSFQDYLGALEFARRAHKSSGFWLADLLRYGDQRQDWKDRLSQAQSLTGLSEKTLQNVRAVGAIDKSRRRDEVELGHHEAVASLHPEEQTEWLGRAVDEGLSVRELRQHIRAAKRTRVIDGQAVLEGMFRIIYADPPWSYSDSGATADGSLGKADRHYEGMSIEAICKLPVQAHALPDSTLFMWVTTPFIYENPGPREVLEAWGFTYKTMRTWDKVLGNPGHYAMDVTTEHLIIATRGNGMPIVPTPHEKTVFVERRGDEHSGKPESIRKWIEKHWTRGPYLELFGREPHDGWSVFGNDARLWAEQSA